MFRSHSLQYGKLNFPLMAILMSLVASCAVAQGLNWEGQTGAFATPFAYTSQSPAKGVGRPQVAFHYMNTGEVMGNNMQASVTMGMLERVEFGYTRSFQSSGKVPGLSSLFEGGFNTVHGKVMLSRENAGKTKFLPAIATGFVVRSQVRHVGGVLTSKDTVNGDVYVAATKTVTQVKGLPFVINVGMKATNGSVLGIAGNASAWQGRAFGALAFVFKGPKTSTLIVGSEAMQQPRFIKDLPGATVPTTLTYFIRVIPMKEKPFNIDFGIAQAAGKIAPGVDLKGRSQVAMGVSYRF